MVRLLHWLIRFYQIAISPLLDHAVAIFQHVLNILWKQSIRMVLYVVCGWLQNVFVVVIRGVVRAMIRCRQKSFVLFHFSK